jgi:hypothetical protein
MQVIEELRPKLKPVLQRCFERGLQRHVAVGSCCRRALITALIRVASAIAKKSPGSSPPIKRYNPASSVFFGKRL